MFKQPKSKIKDKGLFILFRIHSGYGKVCQKRLMLRKIPIMRLVKY